MNRTLYEWFGNAAARHPDEVALQVGDATLSYRELAASAGRLAAVLAARPGGPPQRVGLAAARCPLAYAGYLAALQLGASVVPMNPAFPDDRNVTMARAAGIDVLLAEPDMAGRLRGDWATVSGPDGPGDPGAAAAAADGAGTAAKAPGPDSMAYLLFTSGSTGTPKGVPITHGNVSRYLGYTIERYQAGPGCRFSQTFDLTFDPSVFDMFVAWGSGATLVIPAKDEVSDPVSFVTQQGITHWFSVPSVVSLARRMRRLPPESMPDLRWSLFAGEQLTLAQAAAWRAAAPASTMENLYGPTELTITCTGYRLPKDPGAWPTTRNNTVPIGQVYPHLDHVVIGADGYPAEEGELCVRGPQRFPGYLDPANNVGRFVEWAPGHVARQYDGAAPLQDSHWYRTGNRVQLGSGGLVHLGRLDSQVKIHGYRVELGEIEAVLRSHPAIQDTVALAADKAGSDDLRVAYTGDKVSAGELIKLAGRRLPWYMVPRQFTHLDEFPHNANGKVDRAQLEALVLEA